MKKYLKIRIVGTMRMHANPAIANTSLRKLLPEAYAAARGTIRCKIWSRLPI